MSATVNAFEANKRLPDRAVQQVKLGPDREVACVDRRVSGSVLFAVRRINRRDDPRYSKRPHDDS
jgi:hypothetical protein